MEMYMVVNPLSRRAKYQAPPSGNVLGVLGGLVHVGAFVSTGLWKLCCCLVLPCWASEGIGPDIGHLEWAHRW